MRLGFYANATERTAEFAHRVASEAWNCLHGRHLHSMDTITDKQITAILKDLESKDIEISALGYYQLPVTGQEGC